MAKKNIFLSLLTLLHLCGSILAVRQASWQQGQCQISRINAEEPSYRVRAEGGESEYWDHKSDGFQCVGVSLQRHRVRSKGLMLPAYQNGPILAYVVQGRGIFGILVSGCPETFESPQQTQQSEGEERRERFRDRHQRIEHFKTGDIIAIPGGAAHWAYNTGDEELIIIAMQDTGNNANQLDPNPRSFLLAGNTQRRQEQQEQHGGGRMASHHEHGNIFRGFDVRTLSEAFGVDEETARSLQGENDERGHIVTVKRGLQVITPPLTREEYGRRGREGDEYRSYNNVASSANGLEETICTAKVRENIDKASRADIYNPRAGRLATVNSLTLPILGFFRLSAARGVLYKNAIMAPHWFINAHSIVYITRGESRMQIVDHRGQAVFDGEVREGQAVVVPQNFAVMKQAGEQGCEWVEFNTNGNAMMNTLAGRTSALRGMPADVIANAYRISTEEAERLKSSRTETLLFAGRERSQRGRVASA